MEGCHWMFRKTSPESWHKVLNVLLEGRSVKAKIAVGWLIDYTGPLADCIKVCWSIAKGESTLTRRAVNANRLTGVPTEPNGIEKASGPAMQAGRQAILDTIRHSCGVPLSEAITIQAKHSGEFMSSSPCRNGMIGSAFAKSEAV